jgi:hypothetical protein
VVCAEVDGNEAWFRTVITSDTSGLSFFAVGEEWVWKVVDNGEPGIGADTWQASNNLTGSEACLFDPNQFGTFALIAGNIQVNS